MSKIEWTDRTWNPIIGCSKCSPGCLNCYAERMARRQVAMGTSGYNLTMTSMPHKKKFRMVWSGDTVFRENQIEKPLHWKTPSNIFVCSMSDLFHPSVPFEWIDKIFAVMILSQAQMTRNDRDNFHIFQLLTKRPEITLEYYNSNPWSRITKYLKDKYDWNWGAGRNWYPENIWLGVTAENQEQADKRIPVLLQIPAALRFVSVEPMLGPVDLNETSAGQVIGPCGECGEYKGNCDCCMGIPSLDWVIAGGESGPGARPMHPDWARSLWDQCAAAGVPFFFKQWGKWKPCDKLLDCRTCSVKRGKSCHSWSTGDPGCSLPVGKKWAGCLLDGIEHKEYPGAL